MGPRGSKDISELRAARLARKRTLQEQAARLGVSRVALLRYETGQRVPGPTLLKKIFKDLGVSPNQLHGIGCAKVGK